MQHGNMITGQYHTYTVLLVMARPAMCLLTGVLVIAGTTDTMFAQGVGKVLALAFSESLLVAAVFLFNDIYDRYKDACSVTFKPLSSGIVDCTQVRTVAWSLLALSLLLGLSIGPLHCAFLLGQSLLAIPFYASIKSKNGLAANVLTALLFASALCLSGVTELGPAHLYAVAILTVFLIGREIWKDVVDIEADASANVPTLPILLGETSALTLANGCLVLSALMLSSWIVVKQPSDGMILGSITAGTICLLLVSRSWQPKVVSLRSALLLSGVPMILGIAFFSLVIR